MPHDIRPLAPEDIPELSRFLTEGFHTPPDAPFAAPDVLRWKYFEPSGRADAPRSWVAREEGGGLIGHLGICASAFLGAGVPGGEVPTLHMIDWLSTRPGSGVGARLMLRAHQGTRTAYALGASTAARTVMGGGGYRLAGMVPVYQRVLRLGTAWRAGRLAHWGRDLVRALRHRPRKPRAPLALRPVDVFGPEIDPVLAAYQRVAVWSDRRPAVLNRLLRYPRGGITGWLLTQGAQVRGFALLSLVEQGGVRLGRLVDCVLDELDPGLWHAGCYALAEELARQGADTATGFASTGWAADALRSCGFVTRHGLEFRVRDKAGLVPAGAVFHVTPLEADYAYT
ncbi:MAG: acetyltransferase [Isosphaeraceae bacterium]|nr:acetyltransferase [Isosphaeraceae bacterium]